MRRLALLLVLLAPWTARAAAAPAVREFFDLRYYPGRESRHTLDVFAPKKVPAGGAPVVLFVHGGTWMIGDKNFHGVYRNVGRGLAQSGVVAVLINYRLSPRVKHPEHARDVARAFAWVYKNADRYGGDPKRIILAGHSAGGHLAALVATDRTYLDAKELKLDAKARQSIRGVISLSGVYRIPQGRELKGMVAEMVDIMVPANGKLAAVPFLAPTLRGIGAVANPFAVVFGRGADVQRQASPINFVRAGLPPFLIVTAESEVPGLAKMADDFVKALKDKNVPVEQRTIDDVTHKSIVKELHRTDTALAKMVAAFVTKHAGKPAPGDRS